MKNGLPAELAVIVDAQAVGMVQGRERAELALEPLPGRAGERCPSSA